MKAVIVLALILALSGCVMPQVYVTSMGPVRISPDSEFTIFDVQAPEPMSLQGGLMVRTLNGRPVPLEARDAALEAIEAHCLDYDFDAVPYLFGWREVDGEGHWTAAGCEA